MRDCGAVRLVGFLRAGQSLFWYINNGWDGRVSLCVTRYFPRRPCVGVAGSPWSRPVVLCSAAVHFLICLIDRVRNRWNGVLIAGNNAFYGSTFIAVVSRIGYDYNVFTAHYEDDNNVFFRCSPFCTIFIWLRRTASLVAECSLQVCGDAGSNSGMVKQSLYWQNHLSNKSILLIRKKCWS